MKNLILLLGLVFCICNSIMANSKTYNESIENRIDELLGEDGYFLEPLPPPPPDNDICTGATVIELDCGYSEFFYPDPGATGDPEASGICLNAFQPAQWYTFTTPDPLPYNYIQVSDAGGDAFDDTTELFSSSSGCDDLVFEACDPISFYFLLSPGTTYYLLSYDGLTLFTQTVFPNSCTDNTLSNINPNNLDFVHIKGSTNCGNPSSDVLCHNDHVRWHTYTTENCTKTDMVFDIWEPATESILFASELSISVFLDDCETLASEYDVNGFGYACDVLANSETLTLEDVPGGVTILIAIGSDGNYTGHYDFRVNFTYNIEPVSFETCQDAEVVTNGLNTDFTNYCASMSGEPYDIGIVGCFDQSESTVWYEYDPGPEPQDVLVTLLSNGIENPSMAAYNGCIGDLMGVNCGSTLELFCVNSTIYIEIGSSQENSGEFDLEITASPSVGSFDILNDICEDAILLTNGLNTDLTNLCATYSGPPIDAIIGGCVSQSESTVWYEFDPGSVPQDVVINLTSTGIESPALGAYEGCIGDLLAITCSGTTLELYCVDFPIMIEVGSGAGDSGGFDLEISTSPSPPILVPVISGDDICSDTETDIIIEIPTGEIVNFTVEIASSSSSSISGMTTQNLTGVNSIVINDVLTNTTSTAQEAIYLIRVETPANTCQIEPIEFAITVFPDFVVSELGIEECLPHLLELNLSEIIEGGTLPYTSIAWYWNASLLIGSTEMLSYDIEESGDITVEVIDNEGCKQSAIIHVETIIPFVPTFDFPLQYCRYAYDMISFATTSLENIAGEWSIPIMDLSIYDEDGFYDLEFMPTDQSCTEAALVTIEIFTDDILEFDLPIEFCSADGIYQLPTEDINGVVGNWNTPIIDLSNASGVQSNSFIANSGCHLPYDYYFEVNPSVESNFGNPDSICKGEAPFLLSNFSEEGFEGVWDNSEIDPSQIVGNSFTSTWTPVEGQSPCLEEVTIVVAILDLQIPDFDLPNRLCANEQEYTFPVVDNENINGSWSIATIDPSAESGIIQSIFTPDDSCAETFTWDIEIIEPLTPEFSIVSSLCSLDPVYTLPLISDNGISGTWSIPIVDPSLNIGEELVIEFQGEGTEFCIEPVAVIIEIIEAQEADFTFPSHICWTDEDLLLPTISSNGIQGIWTPSVIEVQPNQGTTINSVFTPSDGSCTNDLSQLFEIVAPYNIEVMPTNPSDCAVADGTISLNVIQGDNLQFSLDGGMSWQDSPFFTALNSGAYIILARSMDFQSCILELETFLNTVDGPTINNVESNDINSCVEDNGSIIVNAEGSNLEYSIDGGVTWQSSNEFENLPPDSYLIHIREFASDCIVEASALIEDFPQTEIITIIPQDLSDCETDDGIIEILATGEALEYSIDNGLNWTSDNIFIDLSAGEYMIIVRSTIGDDCVMNAEVELTAPEMPSILGTEIQNPSQCVAGLGSMQVDAAGENLEYSINGGITWQDSPMFTDLDVDDYQLVIRDKDRINCSDETSFSIIKEEESLLEPTFSITSPSVCGSDDGVLEVTSSSTEFEFSIDGGLSWQEDKIFNNLTSDVYTLITRKILLPDCNVEQIIVIPDSDCPCNDLMVTFDIDNISCIDEGTATVELSAVGMIDTEIDITWQNGTTGTNVEGLGFGWQTVTIMYDVHCIWLDSVFIDQLESIEFELQVVDNNCPDASNGVLEVINIIGGDGTYEYSIDGVNYLKKNIFSGLESRVYDVYVRDETNCLTIQEIEILTQGGIDIQLPAVEVIKAGEKILLDPILNLNGISVDSFVWRSKEGILSTIDLALEVSPATTTTYALEVYFGDCIELKDITIEVLLDEDSEQENEQEDEIYLGNIFSPNGDNINDYLLIQGLPNSKIILEDFSVYDRWGNELFNHSDPEFNNVSKGWDGAHKGKLVNPGVYIYMIRYIQNDKSELKIGTVTLHK